MIEYIKPSYIAVVIASVSLLWSIFNHIVGILVKNKIMNNDLKHLNKDVRTLKSTHDKDVVTLKEESEKKDEKIIEELHQVFLTVRRLERKQDAHLAVCDERHKGDNNCKEL